MQYLAKFLAAAIAITVTILAFMGYFFRSANPETQRVYDGLGRELSVPPEWAQLLITPEPLWAGIGWYFFDIVWFFGGLALAYALYDWSQTR